MAYLNRVAVELRVQDVPVVVGVASLSVEEASDGGIVAHAATAVEGQTDADPLALDVAGGGVVSLGFEPEVFAFLEVSDDHVAFLEILITQRSSMYALDTAQIGTGKSNFHLG
jgi:hypothetical protein